MQIVVDSIDTKVRRILASTAVLQAQVVACCCKGTQQPPPPPASVTLKSILVWTSAVVGTTAPPGGLGTPSSPAGPWTATPPALALQTSDASFDFELVLSGAAPTGGFGVTVKAVATNKGTVELVSGPFAVAAGKTESAGYNGNTVTAPPGITTTVTITATANNDSSNFVTATVTFSEPSAPK